MEKKSEKSLDFSRGLTYIVLSNNEDRRGNAANETGGNDVKRFKRIGSLRCR